MKNKMLIPLCLLILSACNQSDNPPSETTAPGITMVAPVSPTENVQDVASEENASKDEDSEEIVEEPNTIVFDQAAFDAKIALLPVEEELLLDAYACTPSKNITYRDLRIVYKGNDIFELSVHFVGITLKLNLSLMQDQLVMISTDTQSNALLKNLAAQGLWSVKDATESSLKLGVKAADSSCELTFKLPAPELPVEEEITQNPEPTPEQESEEDEEEEEELISCNEHDNRNKDKCKKVV